MKEFCIVVKNKEQSDLVRNTLERFGYNKATFIEKGYPKLLVAEKFCGKYITSGADRYYSCRHEEISMKEFEDMFINKQMYTEDYFKSYKHIIGCDFESVITKSGNYLRGAFIIDDRSRPIFLDNMMGGYPLVFIKFYIDDETLGTYEEYMNVHYPEYKHWWEIK